MEKYPLKIVYAITALPRGGAERFLVDLLKNLDRRKFEPQVITVVRGGELESEIRALGIPLTVFHKKTKLGLGVIWQIYKYLRRERPFIFHSQLFGGDTWGRSAAILARVPVIITTEQNINLDEGFFKKTIKMILSWFTDKVVAISEAVKNYSISVDCISPKKMEVIYNGTEVEKFLWSGPKFFQNNPSILLTVGRLEPQKGHKILFKALSLIKELPWKLRLVGKGSLEDELTVSARDLGIAERVEFLGGREDISGILKSADVFILPSIWEGLGIVILEAALAARPIIASATGGIPEIIKDGESGWLVKPKDSLALAEAIKNVLENKGEAERRALLAQADVRRRFDIKNITKCYEQLYEDLTRQ
ncbi:MAG: glycosyltransferase [Patescibacteria group bacterium]|nr:glycosyltransferase [Patescibacteria group bacterium]MDD5490746.1 glycosyltransferase [Patescibacteria group bacterium]